MAMFNMIAIIIMGLVTLGTIVVIGTQEIINDIKSKKNK